MKKLKTILQCNNIYYILLFFSIIYTFIFITRPINSIYSDKSSKVYGYVTEYKIKDNKISIYLNSKENIIVNYYYKDKNEIENIKYGDYLLIKGKFNRPNNNTNFNLFNYKKYLLSKKIKYVVKADKIIKIRKTNNVLYKLKNKLVQRVDKCSKSSHYIKTFLFADKNYIDEEIISNYQILGISHLFAISGMHVSFISIILLKLLFFMKKDSRYIFISLLLIIYLFLTNYSVSMARSCFQFILFFINKKLKLNIKNINLVILFFSIILFYNPYYIYNVGFIFSFTISFTLIYFNELLMNGSFFIRLLKISLLSFLVSLPIIINNFYQINILSIIFNILYVPFVSYILFPLNVLTITFPFLDSFNYFIINIFEKISTILSNVNILSFNCAKLPIFIIVIYYILIYKIIRNISIKNVVYIILIIIIFIFYKSFVIFPTITFLDVKQGDCLIVRILNKNILIDTGGISNYNNFNYDLSKNILIPFFESEGIKKIDYLILTHGDFDHMGEAINLVNNFKVEKVIFNCGPYNDLEKELIKVLNKKKIKYYSCIKELNIDNNKLYFLQTKEYDSENDNSNVIYTELNGYKFMFMGDAGVDKEKDILDKYNLSNIDVLKVGHHGSKTSSSKEFIDEINPKYSIISVGKNNRYGHPNKEVLNNLEDSKIYRTDQDGSIMFKIKNNKLQIETCSP